MRGQLVHIVAKLDYDGCPLCIKIVCINLGLIGVNGASFCRNVERVGWSVGM